MSELIQGAIDQTERAKYGVCCEEAVHALDVANDRVNKLQAEVARLKDAIREHRDSFSKDMDEHDWTTEDEALWELIDEKKPPGGLGG